MTDPSDAVDGPPQYPYFMVVSDDTIEQGDILTSVPSPRIWLPTSAVAMIADDEFTADFDVDIFTAVILSQSCDLDASKIDQVILGPVFDIEDLRQNVKAVAKPSNDESVRKGRVEGLYMLPQCTSSLLPSEKYVVNFRNVFTLPYQLVKDHAGVDLPRLRLLPPYREHLAQAFAHFVMRIGFP